jgi:glycosyltransferase involved in cell wall biosynthesis
VADKKIKVLTLSDHPLLPSGVGTQTYYIIKALLDSGKFEVLSFGGAVNHKDYTPQNPDGYEGRWQIFPIDGYGDPPKLRAVVNDWKPDIVYFMTDPRFYGWLWSMAHEIRDKVPLVYYHVWDNKPYPTFNKPFYDSNDFIATISKVTSDIVQVVSPDVPEKYIPHAVDSEIFKPATTASEKIKCAEWKSNIPHLKTESGDDKLIFFWNNRNARRKQSGTLLYWWKDFLDIVGHDKAILIMHTDVNDQHGQPLDYIISSLDIDQGQVMFSTKKLPSDALSNFYKIADCTINVSDAEGFGLATLESLSCETPIIVTMTGGLQEQVTDGENWFGIGIEPASKSIIGSQQVPWIYEDRISGKDFVDSLVKFYKMDKKDRDNLGKMGREHVLKNYNFKDFNKTWVDTMLNLHERCGSWENRKNYQSWELIEL